MCIYVRYVCICDVCVLCVVRALCMYVCMYVECMMGACGVFCVYGVWCVCICVWYVCILVCDVCGVCVVYDCPPHPIPLEERAVLCSGSC